MAQNWIPLVTSSNPTGGALGVSPGSRTVVVKKPPPHWKSQNISGQTTSCTIHDQLRIVPGISTPCSNIWAGYGHVDVMTWLLCPVLLFVFYQLKLFFKMHGTRTTRSPSLYWGKMADWSCRDLGFFGLVAARGGSGWGTSVCIHNTLVGIECSDCIVK